MKKKRLHLLLGGLLLWVSLFSYAQAPESLSYQAIVRDSESKLSVNKEVGVRISILLDNESVIYVETHSATTNGNGLMSLQIGNGSAVSGVFSSIDWGLGTFFVKTEIDPSGGKNYSISSVTQLLSVPYALYAKTAQKLSVPVSYNDLLDIPTSERFSGDYNDLENTPDLFSGDYGDLENTPVLFSGNYNDLQGTPVLFDGKYTSLSEKPTLFSGSYKDLKNQPLFRDSVEKYGFSGNYNDLSNTPPSASFTGDYNDLLNKPFFKDSIVRYNSFLDYNGLRNKPNLFSGIYNDLIGVPSIKDSIQKHGFSGDYNDLSNTPSPALFTGDYNDLLNKPVIKDSVHIYGFDGAYENLSGLPSIKDSIDIYAFSGSYNDLTDLPAVISVKDTVDKYSFSGEYDDLKGKPKGVNEGDILYWLNNKWSVLPLGLDGQVLTSVNSQLVWKDISLFIKGDTETYEVGDVFYQEGEPEGVIIEVSQVGQYGKLLSLSEYEVAWDLRADAESEEHPTETFSRNSNSGEVNMSNIKSLSDGIEKFPAFNTCATHGGGWYLPALNEMLLIASKKADLNTKLQGINGAQLLEGNFYWTSTEARQFYAQTVVMNDSLIVLCDDVATPLNLYEEMLIELDFSAYLDEDGDLKAGMTPPIDTLLATGSYINVNKVEALKVRPIRRMSWTEVSSKPKSDIAYSIGGLYYNADSTTVLGVVCETWNGGFNGKIISLNQDSIEWSSIAEQVSTTNRSDGSLNRDKLQASFAVENYPAFSFCIEKGTNWYLPAIDELRGIYNNIDVLNTALSGVPASDLLQKAAEAVDPNPEDLVYYWSSTEKDIDNATALNFGASSATVSDDVTKAEKALVRAVRTF